MNAEDGQPPTPVRKSRWLNWLAPVVLLVALALFVDLRAVADALLALSGEVLAAALLLATFDRFVMTYKWRQLVQSANASLPFLTALRIHYQSMVSGRVIPLPLGADVLRAWLTTSVGIPEGLVLGSIVIEKLMAMLAAIFLALAGLIYLSGRFPPGVDQWTLVSLMTISLCAAVAAILLVLAAGAHRRGKKLYDRINAGAILPRRFGRLLLKTSRSLLRFRSRPVTLAIHAGLAIFEYAIQLAKLLVLAYGLNIPSDPLIFSAIAAVALFMRRIAGILESWAIGDGSAIVTLALLGIDAERAVALFVANFAISTIAILPGLVFFYTHPVKLRAGVLPRT